MDQSMINQQIYDDIDFRNMQDWTRMGELGITPAELARADADAHATLCDYILEQCA